MTVADFHTEDAVYRVFLKTARKKKSATFSFFFMILERKAAVRNHLG